MLKPISYSRCHGNFTLWGKVCQCRHGISTYNDLTKSYIGSLEAKGVQIPVVSMHSLIRFPLSWRYVHKHQTGPWTLATAKRHILLADHNLFWLDVMSMFTLWHEIRLGVDFADYFSNLQFYQGIKEGKLMEIRQRGTIKWFHNVT